MLDVTDDRRLLLNPALRVIRGSDDELVVRQGSRGRSSQRVSDGARRGVLADLALAFADGARLGDVLEAVPDPAGRELVGGLLERRILIDEAAASFAFLTAGLDVDPAACAVGSVDVVGSGRLAEAAGDMIRDALPEPVAVRRHGDLRTVQDGEDIELLVCAADTYDAPFFFDVNEFALTSDVRWHAAYADGLEAVVGPLYVPGMTGCFHDFDVLDEAGRSMRVEHLFGKLNRTPARGHIPLYAAAMAASYLVASLLQDVFGLGSYLEGHLLRLDLDRLEVIRQQLSRLARCPACAEGRPDLRHPFL
jgi:bacteriocin biosynthesis cyclodehydratase domain-containing protein